MHAHHWRPDGVAGDIKYASVSRTDAHMSDTTQKLLSWGIFQPNSAEKSHFLSGYYLDGNEYNYKEEGCSAENREEPEAIDTECLVSRRRTSAWIHDTGLHATQPVLAYAECSCRL